MYDLDRFLDAQKSDYETALRELDRGRKTSHWIWYIFPQLAGLGYSDRAKFFGISDIEEARAFMNHRSLGPRYLKCIEALMKHKGQAIEDTMGGEVDAKKLRSSLTLMQAAGGGVEVRRALDIFFDGKLCTATMAELANA